MPNILNKDEIIIVEFENSRFNYKGYVEIYGINVEKDGGVYCKYKNCSISEIDRSRIFGPQIGFPSEKEDVYLSDFGWRVIHRDPDVAKAISARIGDNVSVMPTGFDGDKRYLRYFVGEAGTQYTWKDGQEGDWDFAALRVQLQLETAYLSGQYTPIRW